MEYITASTDEIVEKTESMRIRQIHENVRKLKASEKMGVKYMQRWEEIAYARQEGRLAGKSEGEILKLIKLICKKICRNKTIEEIAEDLEEEPEAIRSIYESARKFAPEFNHEKIYEDYSTRGCVFPEKDVK